MRSTICCTLAALVLLAACAAAQEVWSGATHYFEKEDWADWTQPENQDRITDNAWLTRADGRGLFNIAQEDEFDSLEYLSPLGTEWSQGAAADWESLSFQTWDDYNNLDPWTNLDQPSVVHLIDDDIYIDITLVQWTRGQGGGVPGGGGFAYWRAPSPTPVLDTAWSDVKALY